MSKTDGKKGQKSAQLCSFDRGGRLKLLWQCPYMETTHFKKWASLTVAICITKALNIALAAGGRGEVLGLGWYQIFTPAPLSYHLIHTSDWNALYPWCSQWHWSFNVYRFSIIAGYWKLILLTIKSNWTFLMKCSSSVASIWWTSRVLTSFAKTWQPLRWIFN